jgi:MscS family membrane protein
MPSPLPPVAPLQTGLDGLLEAVPLSGAPLGVTIVALSAVLAVGILRTMRGLSEVTRQSRFRFDGVVVRVVSRPLAITVALAGLVLGIRQVQGLAPWLARWPGAEAALGVVAATWIVAGLVREVVEVYGQPRVEASATDFDDRLLGIVDLAATLVVWAVGILVALRVLGIEITPVLASMGVAGLAVALAVKTILSNFFGGLVVTADRTVQPGHRVKVGDWQGDVVDIGRYKTTIRTRENLLVSIPNDQLMSETVINYNLPESRTRVEMEVGVAYGTDLEAAEEIIESVVEEVDGVVDAPAPEVHVASLGDSAVVLEVLAWQQGPRHVRRTRDEVYRETLRRFEEVGVEVPYPHVDVGFRDEPPG